MPNYFQALPRAMNAEWASRAAHAPQALGTALAQTPAAWALNNDGNRYFWVTDNQGREVAKWECRPFPNCAALVVTTQFVVHEEMRNQGVGRALRDLQLRAYRAAGFTGEIATVRSDNTAQAAMMVAMGYRKMETFGSPYGGTVDLWLKRFDVVQAQPAPAPPALGPWYAAPAPVAFVPPQARPDAMMWRGYVRPPTPAPTPTPEEPVYSHQKKV